MTYRRRDTNSELIQTIMRCGCVALDRPRGNNQFELETMHCPSPHESGLRVQLRCPQGSSLLLLCRLHSSSIIGS